MGRWTQRLWEKLHLCLCWFVYSLLCSLMSSHPPASLYVSVLVPQHRDTGTSGQATPKTPCSLDHVWDVSVSKSSYTGRR